MRRDVRAGRRSTIGNRVYPKRVSGVQIPVSPPLSQPPCGGVAERLNAAVSKTVSPITSVTRVRIPAPPPLKSQRPNKGAFFISEALAWIRTDEGSSARKSRSLLPERHLAHPARYTTANLPQMSAAICSIFAVVYENLAPQQLSCERFPRSQSAFPPSAGIQPKICCTRARLIAANLRLYTNSPEALEAGAGMSDEKFRSAGTAPVVLTR